MYCHIRHVTCTVMPSLQRHRLMNTTIAYAARYLEKSVKMTKFWKRPSVIPYEKLFKQNEYIRKSDYLKVFLTVMINNILH